MSYIARTVGRGKIGLICVALEDWSVGASEPWVISSVVPIHTDFAFGRKILGCEMKRNIIPRIDYFIVPAFAAGFGTMIAFMRGIAGAELCRFDP